MSKRWKRSRCPEEVGCPLELLLQGGQRVLVYHAAQVVAQLERVLDTDQMTLGALPLGPLLVLLGQTAQEKSEAPPWLVSCHGRRRGRGAGGGEEPDPCLPDVAPGQADGNGRVTVVVPKGPVLEEAEQQLREVGAIWPPKAGQGVCGEHRLPCQGRAAAAAAEQRSSRAHQCL